MNKAPVESDPVLIAHKQYESLRDSGATQEVVEQAWKVFEKECERVMREKDESNQR